MIGATTSQSLDLTLINKGDMVYGTSTIKVEIGLKIGDTTEYILMGIYNIDDIEKTDYTIKITAFDNMIKFETPYFSTLGDTPTLQQVVNELSSKTGVQFVGSLPAYNVKKLEGFTCREILGYVASLCGGNAVITRDGKFTIVTPKDNSYSIGTANYIDYKREETKYKIGKVSCQAGEEVLSKGSLGADSMELQFENPWINATILTDIYNKLNGFEYLGYSMKWQGDLSLDVGDIVTITDKKGVVRKHPILSQKFTYTGGLTSEISAKGENKNKNEFSSSGPSAKKVERVVMELALINKALIEVAYIGDLTANNIKFDTASGGTLDLQSLLVKFVSGENGQYLNLTSSNVVIDNAVIKDLIAPNISVGDLKAGNIDSNRFNIVGSSGNLLIKDNTIQIKDANRTRVQIGKDAANDYNMYVWDSTGKLMFDATGLKADGIKSKIIRDDMISDTANINGSKINISSLITEVNKDTNTQVIKASKIAFDSTGQSLEVSFNSLKSNVDGIQVGGRNLLKDSAIERATTRFLEVKTYDILSDYIGKQIVISFDIKAQYARTIQLYPFQNNGVSIAGVYQFIPTTDVYKRFSFVTTVKDWGINNPSWTLGSIAFYDISANNNYTIKNIKIELGNKATDWTPAIEDVDSKIEANTTDIETNIKGIETLVKNTTIEKDGQNIQLKDAYTNFTQEYNEFKLNVSNTYTTKTETSALGNLINQNKQNIRCNDLGAKINYSTFTTLNQGEIYLHGFDSNNNPSDVNGTIYWNGKNITVPKGMIDPNSDYGIGGDIYLFMNVTNQSVVMGAWYDSTIKSWKYKMLIGGTSTGILNPTSEHVAIGIINMKDAESFNYAYLFETPQSLKALTVGSMDILTRMNSAELKITDSAITASVSNAINAGTAAITTTQFVMDTTGLTVKNGAIKIQNKAGTTVLSADVNGNLSYTGKISNIQDGYGVEVDQGGVLLNIENEIVGGIRSSRFHANTSINGISIVNTRDGEYIDLGFTDSEAFNGGVDFTAALRISKVAHELMGNFKGVQFYDNVLVRKGRTVFFESLTNGYYHEMFGSAAGGLAIFGEDNISLGYKSAGSKYTILRLNETADAQGNQAIFLKNLSMDSNKIFNANEIYRGSTTGRYFHNGWCGSIEAEARRVSNLNVFYDSGWYGWYSGTNGAPEGYGLMLHLKLNADDFCQVAFGINNTFYTRWYANHAWTSWIKR